MEPLASIDALVDRLGSELSGLELERARAAINDASALIRSEAGTDFEEVPAIIESICLAVAYRAFRNPDGTSQTSIGDVSLSFRREGQASAVFLSKAERRAIRKAAGGLGATSITISTPYMSSEVLNYYVDVEGSEEPFYFGALPWEQ